jgi:hypothetical protein
MKTRNRTRDPPYQHLLLAPLQRTQNLVTLHCEDCGQYGLHELLQTFQTCAPPPANSSSQKDRQSLQPQIPGGRSLFSQNDSISHHIQSAWKPWNLTRSLVMKLKPATNIVNPERGGVGRLLPPIYGGDLETTTTRQLQFQNALTPKTALQLVH